MKHFTGSYDVSPSVKDNVIKGGGGSGQTPKIINKDWFYILGVWIHIVKQKDGTYVNGKLIK